MTFPRWLLEKKNNIAKLYWFDKFSNTVHIHAIIQVDNWCLTTAAWLQFQFPSRDIYEKVSKNINAYVFCIGTKKHKCISTQIHNQCNLTSYASNTLQAQWSYVYDNGLNFMMLNDYWILRPLCLQCTRSIWK